MEFDKLKVYTAANADELKVGSKVLIANSLACLMDDVDKYPDRRAVHELTGILDPSLERRFEPDHMPFTYSLAYLISEPEPEEKKSEWIELKWYDLKVGDIIRNGEFCEMITGIHNNPQTDKHIFVQGKWITDAQLIKWEKVEQ